MIWEIKKILHSGRKGVRWDHVEDVKYEGLVGCRVRFRIENVKQFYSLQMSVIGHEYYEWWDTSPIIQFSRSYEDNKYYVIETINTAGVNYACYYINISDILKSVFRCFIFWIRHSSLYHAASGRNSSFPGSSGHCRRGPTSAP